ncbi:DNA repair protein RecO [Paenibacillus sp. GCM10012307]|uniref:DNA repair protein RecO n=1 Tax=Paenibacillus roseus TaxID=2798579 RepID=A0A934MMB3_9BACL|nr:DNA repair protein RecO [Paenibacillus roseus]MBJ6363115.1 DNA repair protein RecO [Paenibacillus roseus]
MLYRVQGIVIRSMDYGEGNKIVNVLTSTHGKVGIMIRGAKKLRSRYGSLAQLFTQGEFGFFKKGTGLGTLNHGEIIDSHHVLRENLFMAAYASYAVELIDRAFQDDEAGSYLYEQLQACLTGLEAGKDPQIVTHLFEMKVLEAAGYAPEMSACVNCGEVTGTFALSYRLGGLLCHRCFSKDPSRLPTSEGFNKLLRLFRQLDMRRLGNIQVKDTTKKELREGMRLLMDTHLGLKLKSRAFLDQLEREPFV